MKNNQTDSTFQSPISIENFETIGKVGIGITAIE
jgi:hypothetical protein